METARRPTFAPDRASGRHLWTDDAHDLVLLDVMLPDGNGIELLAERRAAGDLAHGTPNHVRGRGAP